jgi:hypothetical protein
MRSAASLHPRRRGAFVPLTAFLLAVLVAMVAFAVDTGWIVLARTELQAAADAAALAGADPLMDAYVQYQLAALNPGNAQSNNQATIISNAMTSARARAKAYASYNGAGGVSSLTLNDSDIEFGFTDGNGSYTAYDSNNPVFPNTIKVTLRRDSAANGSLRLFFAPVIGNQSASLQATASATIMGGVADSVATSSTSFRMLPMAYDVNAWNNFVQNGTLPDGTQAPVGSNGVPYMQVYPCIQNVGNFGMLSLNDSHIGADTIDGWINNGMAPSDVASLKSADLIPLSAHDPNSWSWLADTGLKASNVQTVNNYTGTTFLLPLFLPKDSNTATYQPGVGNGSYYNFNIVQFVGVKIVAPQQVNQQVMVQPAAMVDPSIVFSGQPVPAGTTSSLMTTFTYPRLSR